MCSDFKVTLGTGDLLLCTVPDTNQVLPMFN